MIQELYSREHKGKTKWISVQPRGDYSIKWKQLGQNFAIDSKIIKFENGQPSIMAWHLNNIPPQNPFSWWKGNQLEV